MRGSGARPTWWREKAEARWFVTTDDRLLGTALKRRDQMRVDVVRPEQIAFDEETAK
jgi:hypothetical protein